MGNKWIKFKKLCKRVWYFLWEEESIWSWLANILIAFLVIKFIFYPLLGLALSTSSPVVAVVSGSMDHDLDRSKAICGLGVESNYGATLDNYWDACGRWYEANNITKQEFNSFRFPNGFNRGNIIVIYGSNPKNIDIGDVIVFTKNQPLPIIHRVVGKWQERGTYYFKTKGDHNNDSSPAIGETKISEKEVLGKAVFRIPYLGYIKIWFIEIINLFR